MNKIIIIGISILMLTSLALAITPSLSPPNPQNPYILIEFQQSDLDTTKFYTLPPNSDIINLEIIQHDHTSTESLKPKQIFYPTSTENPDLTYSQPVYTKPYSYSILLKGYDQQVRFFTPSTYYPTTTQQHTTSYFQARLYYTISTPLFTTMSFDPQDPTYEYIIITNETFYSTLNDNFKSWKISTDSKINSIFITNVSDITQSGLYTVNSTYGDAINTTGGNSWIPDGKEVTSNWELFNDTQAKIRNFIRYSYDTFSTRYVLLVGDNDYVPARMATSYAVSDCGSCTGWYNDTSHASDMYYSNLHYSMNNNTNSYWMENECCGTTWDEIDWGTDMQVGRVLACSVEEVFNWINKTKAYVDGNSQGNYLQNFIVACKDNSNAISNQSWTGWVSSWNAFGPNLYDEFPSNITFVNNQNITQAQWTTMNEYVNGSISGFDGIHLIYHTGHGGTLYSTNGGCFRPYQVNNLLTPTFVYTEGCHSANFGETNATRMQRWIQYPECAFAGVSNSAWGWFVGSTYYGEIFMQEMFNETYGNFTKSFCEANNLAKERVGHDPDCIWGMIVKELNFFGDPALEYNWYIPSYDPQIDGPEIISVDSKTNTSYIFTAIPTIKWTSIPNTTQYHLQISNNSAFTDLVINLSDINEINYPSHYTSTDNISFTLPTALPTINKIYYLRVRALTSEELR